MTHDSWAGLYTLFGVCAKMNTRCFGFSPSSVPWAMGEDVKYTALTFDELMLSRG